MECCQHCDAPCEGKLCKGCQDHARLFGSLEGRAEAFLLPIDDIPLTWSVIAQCNPALQGQHTRTIPKGTLAVVRHITCALRDGGAVQVAEALRTVTMMNKEAAVYLPSLYVAKYMCRYITFVIPLLREPSGIMSMSREAREVRSIVGLAVQALRVVLWAKPQQSDEGTTSVQGVSQHIAKHEEETVDVLLTVVSQRLYQQDVTEAALACLVKIARHLQPDFCALSAEKVVCAAVAGLEGGSSQATLYALLFLSALPPSCPLSLLQNTEFVPRLLKAIRSPFSDQRPSPDANYLDIFMAGTTLIIKHGMQSTALVEECARHGLVDVLLLAGRCVSELQYKHPLLATVTPSTNSVPQQTRKLAETVIALLLLASRAPRCHVHLSQTKDSLAEVVSALCITALTDTATAVMGNGFLSFLVTLP